MPAERGGAPDRRRRLALGLPLLSLAGGGCALRPAAPPAPPIVPVAAWGGTETHVAALCRELPRRGFACELHAPAGPSA